MILSHIDRRALNWINIISWQFVISANIIIMVKLVIYIYHSVMKVVRRSKKVIKKKVLNCWFKILHKLWVFVCSLGLKGEEQGSTVFCIFDLTSELRAER